jgi:hypothetical protein
MGVLSDFFIATPEQAARYARCIEEEDEGQEIRTLLQPREWKRFTGLEFGTLWAILEGETWNVKKHRLAHVEHGDEGEWWLERFPPRLIQLLATLDGAQRQSALELWAKTDELRCDPGELDPVLSDLQELARRIPETGETSLYMWGSL